MTSPYRTDTSEPLPVVRKPARVWPFVLGMALFGGLHAQLALHGMYALCALTIAMQSAFQWTYMEHLNTQRIAREEEQRQLRAIQLAQGAQVGEPS